MLGRPASTSLGATVTRARARQRPRRVRAGASKEWRVRVEVVEIVPGEYDVKPEAGETVRVLVPPGAGIPGVAEEDRYGAV